MGPNNMTLVIASLDGTDVSHFGLKYSMGKSITTLPYKAMLYKQWTKQKHYH